MTDPVVWWHVSFFAIGFIVGHGWGHTEGFVKACKKFETLSKKQTEELQKVKEAHVTVNQRFDEIEPRKNEKFT